MAYRLGLFKFVDFTLSGSAFDATGLVSVELSATDAASALAKQSARLRPAINPNSLNRALGQISAEEHKLPVIITSTQELISELRKLDKKAWLLNPIPAQAIDEGSQIVEFIYHNKVPQKEIITSVRLGDGDRLHKNIPQPIFEALVLPIIHTIQDQMSLQFYTYTDGVKLDGHGIEACASVIDSELIPGIDELLKLQIATINYVMQSGVVARLSNRLEWLGLNHFMDFGLSDRGDGGFSNYVGSDWSSVISEVLHDCNLNLRIGSSSAAVNLADAIS